MSVYAKKIEVIFSKETQQVLDGQSKICNWLYNQLLTLVEEDYKAGNKNNYLSNFKLRDHIQKMKEEHPFLRTAHSTVIKNPAYRLKNAYERFFENPEQWGHPHYRSWSKKWYSLIYDNPEAGWKIDGSNIDITLGKILKSDETDNQDDDGKTLSRSNLHIQGRLKEQLVLPKEDKIKTMTIVKQRDKYYVVFSVASAPTLEEVKYKQECAEYNKQMKDYKKKRAAEKEQGIALKDSALTKPEKPKLALPPIPDGVRWISLDPNHKNLCVGYDYKHRSILFTKMLEPAYWDKIIDELKAKRDKCRKTYKKQSKSGNVRTVHSKKWCRYDRAIRKCEHKRAEQIKQNLFRVANALYDEYDLVLIGDYTPSVEVAKFKGMRRSMLNNTFIGQFRDVCEWVAVKRGKYYRTVSEYHSTKACCVCGHLEAKSPDVREFDCPECGAHIVRDVNAAVNIARNFGLRVSLSDEDIVGLSSVDRVLVVSSKYSSLPSLWPSSCGSHLVCVDGELSLGDVLLNVEKVYCFRAC